MKIRRWSRRRAWALGSVALAVAAGAAITSGTASAAITAPARGCCRLLTQSVAAGWGINAVGELGNGTGNLDSAVNPNWTAVTGLSGVAAVSADAAGLALASDGTVWAWGNNLGNGSPNSSDVPVQVPSLSGIVAVSAGSNVSVALRSDGTVWTWAGMPTVI